MLHLLNMQQSVGKKNRKMNFFQNQIHSSIGITNYGYTQLLSFISSLSEFVFNFLTS